MIFNKADDGSGGNGDLVFTYRGGNSVFMEVQDDPNDNYFDTFFAEWNWQAGETDGGVITSFDNVSLVNSVTLNSLSALKKNKKTDLYS